MPCQAARLLATSCPASLLTLRGFQETPTAFRGYNILIMLFAEQVQEPSSLGFTCLYARKQGCVVQDPIYIYIYI